MTRSQRVFAIASLFVLAIVVHTGLCRWRVNFRYYPDATNPFAEPSPPPLLAYTHGPGAWDSPSDDPQRRIVAWRVSGVFPRAGSRDLAFLFGVVAPLSLIGLGTYLLLGWRFQSRLDRGCCPKCGYDLKALASGQTCPECGWRPR